MCSFKSMYEHFDCCASSMDHKHEDESRMNKGYGREGMKKGITI